MNLGIISLQILLGFILFLIMYYLKSKKISFQDQIIIPNIYIILLASIIAWFKDYTLLVIIFYLVIDLISFGLDPKKQMKTNVKTYLEISFLTLLVGVLIYSFFLTKVKSAFVDMEIFKNFLWVLIIFYGYQKLSNLELPKKMKDSDYNLNWQEYVIMFYAKYKNKYHYLIKSKNFLIENLIYSFLIYESYNHTSFYRTMKKIKNKVFKRNTTYGILEIASDHFITEEESISIFKERLENKEKRLKRTNKQEEILRKLIREKYKETKIINEIIKIYDLICDFNKKN